MAMHPNDPRYRRTDPRRTGRGNQLYNAKPARKGHNWACYLLVAVIFVGTFMQISSLAQLMGQNKKIAQEGALLRELREDANNARGVLLQYTSVQNIEKRADKLGMIPPEADQIRRVPVYMAANNSDTNAQTAYGGNDQ